MPRQSVTIATLNVIGYWTLCEVEVAGITLYLGNCPKACLCHNYQLLHTMAGCDYL